MLMHQARRQAWVDDPPTTTAPTGELGAMSNSDRIAEMKPLVETYDRVCSSPGTCSKDDLLAYLERLDVGWLKRAAIGVFADAADVNGDDNFQVEELFPEFSVALFEELLATPFRDVSSDGEVVDSDDCARVMDAFAEARGSDIPALGDVLGTVALDVVVPGATEATEAQWEAGRAR